MKVQKARSVVNQLAIRRGELAKANDMLVRAEGALKAVDPAREKRKVEIRDAEQRVADLEADLTAAREQLHELRAAHARIPDGLIEAQEAFYTAKHNVRIAEIEVGKLACMEQEAQAALKEVADREAAIVAEATRVAQMAQAEGKLPAGMTLEQAIERGVKLLRGKVKSPERVIYDPMHNEPAKYAFGRRVS